MSNIIDEYLNGIKSFPKNKKLSPSSLCKFLDKDPASLKRSRIEKYPYLQIIFDTIDDINDNKQDNKKNESPLEREKRIKENYRDERDTYEKQLKEAYTREVALINRIDELERALEAYENQSHLKLNKPRK